VLRGTALKPLRKNGTITGAQVRMADGGVQDIQSELLLDCSGQATWLANLGGVTGPKYLGAYDKQIAIFSQVSGAVRDPGVAKDANRDQHKDNTLIFYQKKYHWSWFIPLDEDVVSVGVVVPAAYFLEKKESTREFYVRELKELHPELARRVEGRELVEDIHVIPNYSYQVREFSGKGFMCIGDAHRFIDPIFSFGVTVAMREAQLAAPAIRAYLEGSKRDEANPFAEHQLFCEQGIDVLEDVLDSFWEHPLAFAYCVHARFTEFMTDMLAGRIYGTERQPSVATMELRQLLKREGQREQSYLSADLYSIPIGSRYHPERAPLWDTTSPIPSTEEWLGPR
jgi:flavin-dependent dehydrogenase